MRYAILMLIVLIAPLTLSTAAERNVLVEMFTNSHCGLCPPAHASLASYASSSPNASRIRYIYYHVPFPYPDDPLSQVATSDAAGRNQYYGPFSATPVTFFDGINQGNAYAQWGSSLTSRLGVSSPLNLSLTGGVVGGDFAVTATIEAVGSLPGGALVVHFVLVENVSYSGRNGISPQNYVMRKMVTGSTGESLSLGAGETRVVGKTTSLANVTVPLNSGMVVFVQESASKAVLQSEYISYESSVPIELSSFVALVLASGGVELNWRTESETNNLGFEVQEAPNTPENFITIPGSFIAGKGTTALPQQYRYIDSVASAGTWYYRLRQIDLDGSTTYLEPIRIEVGSVTSARDGSSPVGFRLEQNYPNPFNPSTTIVFAVPAETDVRLGIFDLLGQEVRTLVDGRLRAGEHRVVVDATGLAGGAYFYRLVAGATVATRTLVLLR